MKVEIFDWYVLPHAVFPLVGESVSWVNRTMNRVRIAGVGKKVITVEPGEESEQLEIDINGFSDLEYQYSVSGRNVDAIGVITPREDIGKLLDFDPNRKFDRWYDQWHWEAMLDPICACWVSDIVDNLQSYAKNKSLGFWKVFERALKKLESAWPGGGDIKDIGVLLNATQSELEPFARICNVTWDKLARTWGVPDQPPIPAGANTFGAAIKVLGDPLYEVPLQRQKNYMWSYFQIELRKDGGKLRPEQSEELFANYGRESCLARVSDIEALRERLERRMIGAGLSPNLKMDEFTNQFKIFIGAMTTEGRWSNSRFSLWNWLRFSQSVIGLLSDKKLPKLSELSKMHSPFENSCESYFDSWFAGNDWHSSI